jgi:hypothetical protein
MSPFYHIFLKLRIAGLELPYLDAPLLKIIPLVLGSLFLSALVGPLDRKSVV